MQTLAGLLSHLCESLKADRCIHEVSQDESCRFRLAIQKKRCCFDQECLREGGVAPNAFCERLFVVTG